MARIKGSFLNSANYEPQIAAPFDARMKVEYQSDLISAVTWASPNGAKYIYNGMIVAVCNDTEDKNGIYVLNDARNYTDINSWTRLAFDNEVKEIAALVGQVPAEQTVMSVIASLEEKHDKLAEDVYTKEEVDAKITGAYRYCGTVKYYAELPTENLTIGDIYNIETADALHGIAAGDNVAWNGTGWDKLAGVLDLSGYATNDKVDTKFVAMDKTIAEIEANYLKKTSATALYDETKYDITDVPAGTIVDYKDREIRIMCPKDAAWHKQNVGDNGNANMYYMTFKAYAPEGAVSFKEGDRGAIEDKIITFDDESAGIDAYGRKYSVCWLALAMYDAATDTWSYFGKNSTTKKYIGWDYVVEWYDANGHIIGNDAVRINLSNEECHAYNKPYYMANINVNSLVQDEEDIIIFNGGTALK